uniref:mRNA-decapping enzyme 2 n=1 Tax=Syphacia muris TaxID=451379 RepID=A0A0N5ADM9_9BILA
MFRQSEPGMSSEVGYGGSRRSESPESPSGQQKSSVHVYVNKNYSRAAAPTGSGQGKVPGFRSNTSQCQPCAQNIPPEVLDDICWRFLYNIPENERSDLIRTCFQIEQAHWYYVDFFCKDKEFRSKCPDLGQRDFMKHVFSAFFFFCLMHRKVSSQFCIGNFVCQQYGRVRKGMSKSNLKVISTQKVLEQWRAYKSNVPTYGAILLDSTLNYVLLIQGFYARSSWGFPKGKLNECEEPTVCAVREVEEEVGYDISEKISDKLFIQKFVNETLVRLYIITDVPVDFHYAPKTRNEIGKIQWFSIWDLPTDRNDTKTSERIGYLPNNFYTALPFINDLREYVSRQQKKRLKKPKNSGLVGIGPRSASAFDPVLPQQRLESLPPILGTLLPNLEIQNVQQQQHHHHHHYQQQQQKQQKQQQHALGLNIPISQRDVSPSSTFFKPVSTAPLTFTGPSFMELVSSNAAKSPVADSLKTVSLARPVPTKPTVPLLGRPIYQAEKKFGIEKRNDGPVIISNIDGVPHKITESNSFMNALGRAKDTSNQHKTRRLRNKKNKESTLEETNPQENSEKDSASSTKTVFPIDLPEINVKPCEAWMNFKLDISKMNLE